MTCLVVSVVSTRCEELASTVTVGEEDAVDVSSELHSTEPPAVRLTTDKPSTGTDNFVNSDNASSETDQGKVDSQPGIASSGDPADNGVGAEFATGLGMPESVESGPVVDSALKESVLQECLTRTLHRFILLLLLTDVSII